MTSTITNEEAVERIRDFQLAGGEELQWLLEIYWPEFETGNLTFYSNGRLPRSALAPIGGGYYLAKEAAESFLAMSAEALRRFGTRIGVVAAYRTFARQVYFWNLYLSGRGNLAARPGSSNHGLGLAIDLASQHMRWIVDKIGAAYGWAKRWSDAPSEWWHIKFNAVIWRRNRKKLLKSLPGEPMLKYGYAGPSVVRLKKLLYANGVRNFSGRKNSNRYIPYFGKYTKAAVKRFQQEHHLHADGIVGASTWAALHK